MGLAFKLGGGIAIAPWVSDVCLGTREVEKESNKALDNGDGHGVTKEVVGCGSGGPVYVVSETVWARRFMDSEVAPA